MVSTPVADPAQWSDVVNVPMSLGRATEDDRDRHRAADAGIGWIDRDELEGLPPLRLPLVERIGHPGVREIHRAVSHARSDGRLGATCPNLLGFEEPGGRNVAEPGSDQRDQDDHDGPSPETDLLLQPTRNLLVRSFHHDPPGTVTPRSSRSAPRPPRSPPGTPGRAVGTRRIPRANGKTTPVAA